MRRIRTEVQEADGSLGYEPGEYGRGARAVQYDEGTLVVDAVDRRTRRVVWRGWAQADVEAVPGEPDRMRERIQEAVERMFEDFPVPERASGGAETVVGR